LGGENFLPENLRHTQKNKIIMIKVAYCQKNQLRNNLFIRDKGGNLGGFSGYPQKNPSKMEL